MPVEPLLDILHVDDAFVVVNKQSGMLSVPGRGPEKADSVTHRVKQMFPGCICLLYTSPSPRDLSTSRMPSSA